MIRVRRILASDGPLLRQTRLAALADRPGDSTTTVAQAEAHPAEHWDRAASANASGGTQATFFAVEDPTDDEPPTPGAAPDEVVIGMVGAYAMPDGVATMVGLWTTGEYRATGDDGGGGSPASDADPDTVIVGLWAAPGHRDVGVADVLVEAVADWARDSGADRVRLWVVERNEYARRFYESKGFEATGASMPYEPAPSIQQVEMTLTVG